ncbi:MAG: hypothetical protein J6B37_06895 [Clostridia bacterium]|nr:hypothetical protein [Clostridia bacterium]
MKLKELYYRVKYRSIKTKDGAIGIICTDSKKKSDFDKKVDELSKITFPCYKANREVINYIKEKYGFQQVDASGKELENYKANYILGKHPELLSTTQKSYPQNASRETILEIHEHNEKVFEEARNYPFEKLNLDIEMYKMNYSLKGDSKVEFNIIADNTNDEISGSASMTNIKHTEKDDRIIRGILDDIRIYKGVKQEDIDNKTMKFVCYASAVLHN